MTATVFVDTNIFVYARDASEPRKQSAAADWIRELWIEQRGRTSLQVLSEYYATVTRKLDPGLSPDDAWDDVSALFAWEPQQIDRSVIIGAREIESRHALSWWDSMIVAAAQLQNCSLLLTEDLQHGFECGIVTVRNPFIVNGVDGVDEEEALYAAHPKPASRHRGRGRPRRGTRHAP
jgi:predicted nucleic acid-binding protein